MTQRLTRRRVLRAAAGFVAATMPIRLRAKETISYAYLLDPSHDAVVYAMTHGKVVSELIDVEVKALAIPALIQATAARQFDVIQTAAISLPRALDQGLKLTILSTALRYHQSGEGADIWVAADSPIKSVAEVKGKTLGVYGISSTGITLVRLALWKKYGLNVALQGGDINYVELPAPALPAALATGKIDAATLIHSQAYAAAKSGQFRSIAQTARDMYELFGLRMVSAVNVGYAEKLADRPQAFEEFDRLLKASVDYALSHLDEVSSAVGRATGEDPDFFKAWFGRYSDFPAVISDQDIAAIGKLFELSQELGLLKNYPPPASLVWDHALRA
jgi:NitT/TauT family transport system substrate-binding protein